MSQCRGEPLADKCLSNIDLINKNGTAMLFRHTKVKVSADEERLLYLLRVTVVRRLNVVKGYINTLSNKLLSVDKMAIDMTQPPQRH